MAHEPKNILRLHVGLAVAESICVSAFVIETLRAIGGNTLSWAYVVEWPLLGGYAIYMWRKMLREERGQIESTSSSSPEADPRLDEWNAYLAAVHHNDQRTRPSKQMNTYEAPEE